MKHYVREIDVHFLYDLNVILFRIHIENEKEYTVSFFFPSVFTRQSSTFLSQRTEKEKEEGEEEVEEREKKNLGNIFT